MTPTVHRLRYALERIRIFFADLAAGYEPAMASAILAAFVTFASATGIVLGDLPQKADALLGLLATLSALYSGKSTRSKVIPQKRVDEAIVDGSYDAAADEVTVTLPAAVAAIVPTTPLKHDETAEIHES